jgi:hypothetical protein
MGRAFATIAGSLFGKEINYIKARGIRRFFVPAQNGFIDKHVLRLRCRPTPKESHQRKRQGAPGRNTPCCSGNHQSRAFTLSQSRVPTSSVSQVQSGSIY